MPVKNLEIKYVPKCVINKNFLYYFLIAGFCSLIDIGMLYVLTDWLGLFYLFSATFSFIIAQSLNYYLNRRFNFRSKSKQIAKQLTMFVAVNTIGLGISLGILAFLVEVLGLWYILARIVGMVIAVSFNYFMHKRYTFAVFD
ncbi:GtrA family protein [Chloroflexota bacterium]